MKRRGFLTLLAWLAGLGLVRPSRALAELGEATAADALGARLAGLFTDRRSAAAVGRAYLRSAPHERDARRLVEAISGFHPERRRELARADAAALRAWLGRRQREDFEQERVVEVDGWILSETEARLCALAALDA